MNYNCELEFTLDFFFSFCCPKAKRETVTKYCSLNDTNRFAFQNRATSFLLLILLFLPETERKGQFDLVKLLKK